MWRRTLIRIAVIGVVAAAACARELDSLTPFPCAEDDTCPTGWVCDQGTCTFPRCETVNAVSKCDACGAEAFVPCGDGFCPASSVCAGDNTCRCIDGYEARDCTGALCNGQCTHPDLYGCVPTGAARMAECDVANPEWIGDCVCDDGSTRPMLCGNIQSCEQRCRRCDLVDQTCAPGEKCTLSNFESGGEGKATCVTVEGSLAAGAPCTRSGEPGHDDCAPGLYCAQARSGPRTCQRLCYQDENCSVGEQCARSSTRADAEGICFPVCDLFGSDCGADMKCSLIVGVAPKLDGRNHAVAMCIPLAPGEGSGAGLDEGASCSGNVCRRGLVCITGSNGGRCRSLCDNAHPCDAGECKAQQGVADGGGWCSE